MDLSTEEAWAYLLQKPNPWNDNPESFWDALCKLYASASNGKCEPTCVFGGKAHPYLRRSFLAGPPAKLMLSFSHGY